jgi:hypothetical protein
MNTPTNPEALPLTNCSALILARDVLREVEWKGNEKESRCIVCYGHCSKGHEPECSLARAAWNLGEIIQQNSKVIYDLQMLAAEIKGQMMAQLPPMMTLDTETGKVTPTPDADGWVENTGVMPECDISAIRLYDGEVVKVANDKHWAWGMKSPNPEEFDITHYKPA